MSADFTPDQLRELGALSIQRLADGYRSKRHLLVGLRILRLSLCLGERSVLLWPRQLAVLTGLTLGAVSSTIRELKIEGLLDVKGGQNKKRCFTWLTEGKLLAPPDRIDPAAVKAVLAEIVHQNRFGPEVDLADVQQTIFYDLRTTDESLARDLAAASLQTAAESLEREAYGLPSSDPQRRHEQMAASLGLNPADFALAMPRTAESTPLDREAMPPIQPLSSGIFPRSQLAKSASCNFSKRQVEETSSALPSKERAPTHERTVELLQQSNRTTVNCSNSSTGNSGSAAKDELLQEIEEFVGADCWGARTRPQDRPFSALWITAVHRHPKPWSRKAAWQALREGRSYRSEGNRPTENWGKYLWAVFRNIQEQLRPKEEETTNQFR